MISTQNKLTPDQKKYAQSLHLWFTRINAISFGALADSILILYSIRLGADDFLVAIITSFFYLTMPLMIFGKKSIAIRGTSKTFGWCWIGRNSFASLMIFAPIIQNMGYHSAGLILLAISVFGFFAFRGMGITAITPLLGDITNKNDRGSYISKVWFYANLFWFFTVFIIALALQQKPTTTTFQMIVAGGCVAGFISSIFVFKIPETSGARQSGQKPLKEAISYLSRDKTAKKLLIAWVFVISGSALVVPFSMLSLKKGYEYSDQGALIFVIIQILGGLFVSYLNRLLLDRVGPRPMLFLYTSGLCLVSLLWIIAPAEFVFFNTALIFFLIGICSSGNGTSLSHYFLSYIPVVHRVGASLYINIISGICAGLAGSLIGGVFIKLLRYTGFSGLNVYRIYFSVVFFILIFILTQVFRLKPLEDRRIKDVLGIFFSIRDWRALHTLQKLTDSVAEEKDFKLVSKLSEIGSDLSEDMLIQYLESPRFFIRASAITALRDIHFGEKTAQKLITEIETGEYTSAYIAAEVLGQHQVREAIPVLRKALLSEDVFLQGKTMVALTQLRDKQSYDQIIKIFESTTNSRLLIHGLHALVLIKNPDTIPILLRKLMLPSLHERVYNELLFGLCEFFDVGDSFYQLFNIFQNDPETGFISLKEAIDKNLKARPEIKQKLNASVDKISAGHKNIQQELNASVLILNMQDKPHRHIQSFLKENPVEKIPGKLLLSLILILSNNINQIDRSNVTWKKHAPFLSIPVVF